MHNVDYGAGVEALEKGLPMNASGAPRDCRCPQGICSTLDFSSMSQNMHFAVQVCVEL